MQIWSRIILAALVSWLFSVSLALLFTISMTGRFEPMALRIPGAISIAVYISTAIATGMTPIAVWAGRTGGRNLRHFAPLLWIVLAMYIVVGIPRSGSLAIYCLVPLAVVGLLIIGLIPPPR